MESWVACACVDVTVDGVGGHWARADVYPIPLLSSLSRTEEQSIHDICRLHFIYFSYVLQ